MTMRLTNAAVAQAFTGLLQGRVTELSNIRQSGIAMQTAEFDALARAPGLTGSVRLWNATPWTEANSNSDNPSTVATTRNASQAAMTFRVLQRNFPFASMDLVLRTATGGDATEQALAEFSRMWAIDEEMCAVNTLEGIRLANVANNSSDMTTTVGIATGTVTDTHRLTPISLVAALNSIGDNYSAINTIIMHSAVYNSVRQRDANNFVPASKTDFGFATYCGHRIIVSDNCRVIAGTNTQYMSYLVGPGAFAYGAGEASTAIARDELAGNGAGREIVISRRNFILHPAGHALSLSTVPANGVSFTNSELAVAAPWSRVQPRKAVPIAFLQTNA